MNGHTPGRRSTDPVRRSARARVLARRQTLLASCLLANCLLPGCLLPSFEAVEEGQTGGAVEARDVCELPTKLVNGCQLCIQRYCCDEANACAQDKTCRNDVNTLISPVAQFGETFGPLLECMHDSCDAACDVSWGCLGKYDWPEPTQDTITTEISFVDFADPSLPVNGVTVQACVNLSSDTGCRAKVEDADGQTELELPANFDGHFAFSGGERNEEPYLDATVRWSEPIYELAPFTHFMLRDSDLRRLALLSHYHPDDQTRFDASRAHLIVRTQTCLPHAYLNTERGLGAEAAGIVVQAEPNDGASRFFYTDRKGGGGPEPSLQFTTRDGIAGAFEMPVGLVRVTAIRKETGQVVATTPIPLSAGGLGFAYLLPTARR